MSASAETAAPDQSARRRGASEKDTRPLKASPIILRSEYLVSPAARGGRSNFTVAWRNPIQAVMPRTNRSRSGMARKQSSALRSMRWKSLALRGIEASPSLP